MTVNDSKQWISDLDLALSDLSELRELEGSYILITGATGLICSAIVDMLIRYNEQHENKIHVVAACRRYETYYRRFEQYCNRDYLHFAEYDATRFDNVIEYPVDYIIHGASNASPDKISSEPVETMLANFAGTLNLMQIAKQHCAKRLLYISSSEIYGKKEHIEPYMENDYGFVDPLCKRNAYSISKRAAETLCVSFAEEYGMVPVIVRPGHIYGPTASPKDSRASSVFAYASAMRNAIVMKSKGEQIRSYCYCVDCASAILKVLFCGASCEAYNISNTESIISIRDMAEMFAKVGDVNIWDEEASQEEKATFNPMSNSSLNSEKLIGLGWKGHFGAYEGLSHTINILREIESDT